MAWGRERRLAAGMARRLRIQFAGARYHVINRGNLQHDGFATGGGDRVLRPDVAGRGGAVPVAAVLRRASGVDRRSAPDGSTLLVARELKPAGDRDRGGRGVYRGRNRDVWINRLNPTISGLTPSSRPPRPCGG